MRGRLLTLCILATCSTAVGSDVDFPRLHINIGEVAPANWVVSHIDTQAKPYGFDQSPGKDSGLAVTFKGPGTVRGAKGEPTKEAFTIYIMSKAFVPVPVQPPGTPETPSRLIGDTPQGDHVYVKVWSQIGTWPRWEADIQKQLRIGTNQESFAIGPDASQRQH